MMEEMAIGMFGLILTPLKLLLFAAVLAVLLLVIEAKDKAAWTIVGGFAVIGAVALVLNADPVGQSRLSEMVGRVGHFLKLGVSLGEGLAFTISDLLVLSAIAYQYSKGERIQKMSYEIRYIIITIIIIIMILLFL